MAVLISPFWNRFTCKETWWRPKADPNGSTAFFGYQGAALVFDGTEVVFEHNQLEHLDPLLNGGWNQRMVPFGLFSPAPRRRR